MDEEKIKYFKQILTQQLDELLLKTSEPIKVSEDIKDTSPEIVDQACMEVEADYSFHMRERESKLIAKIRVALEKIEEGSFGICEECGEEISEGRLMARPVATLCIKCKKKQELEEKQRGL
ncbi:MAG: RNA polymerase-binding protein DksA [Deltaproteobacteria bacterium]|nr:MAG: RNA polymerase-binding protein DksA [Deltaproteobacteria bacterium]